MPVVLIDTSPLSFPLFLIPGHTDFRNGSDPAEQAVTLDPGTFNFQQISGIFADFTFLVTADGTIDYHPAFDAFLQGRGSTTLTVVGYPVELDGTALIHGLIPVIAGAGAFLMPDQVHVLSLVPCGAYLLQPASGIVADFSFSLDPAGRVAVASEFAGFAATDHNRVTIAGYPVDVDGRSLSHDLLPVMALLHNTFLPHTQINQIRIIPAAGYRLQPGSGLVADLSFDLGADGTIDFPADCDGFLTGRGTSTLVVGGYFVLVDATQADSDLLALANLGLPATTPRAILAVLVPAPAYLPQTAHGVFAHAFAIARDGTVSVAPEVAASMRISTIPRIQIIGATPI